MSLLGLQEIYREALEESIQREGAAMVILDPLYLMLGGEDADKSWNVLPFQRWLLSLRYKYRCAVVVVHHFGKPRAENSGMRWGHRLLGSGTWYNWVDSALYCEALTPEGWEDARDHRGSPVNRRIRIEREWRSAAPDGPLDVRMHMGAPGSLRLVCEVESQSRLTPLEEVQAAVDYAGEEGVLLSELSKSLGLDRRTIRKYAIGSDKFKVERSKRGRGYSYRIYSASGS